MATLMGMGISRSDGKGLTPGLYFRPPRPAAAKPPAVEHRRHRMSSFPVADRRPDQHRSPAGRLLRKPVRFRWSNPCGSLPAGDCRPGRARVARHRRSADGAALQNDCCRRALRGPTERHHTTPVGRRGGCCPQRPGASARTRPWPSARSWGVVHGALRCAARTMRAGLSPARPDRRGRGGGFRGRFRGLRRPGIRAGSLPGCALPRG